jgi:hypothetical protein
MVRLSPTRRSPSLREDLSQSKSPTSPYRTGAVERRTISLGANILR